MTRNTFSTLSSTRRSQHQQQNHNRHHHYHRASGSGNNISGIGIKNCAGLTGLGTVTRVCGNKIRQNYQQHHNPPSASDNNNLHHNNQHMTTTCNLPSIATQVISPSALGGGPLKISGRRFCKHIDAEAHDDDDDDDQTLFGRRQRVPWGKLSCYGISIGVIILILTGVVLAVGYMQSEKQRILSQSQKLSQTWSHNMHNNDSDNNINPIMMMPTTWRPKILFENITRVPVIVIKDTISKESLVNHDDFDDEEENDEDEDDDSVEESQNQRPPLDKDNDGGHIMLGGRSPPPLPATEVVSNEERMIQDDSDELSSSHEDDEELEIYQVPEQQQQQELPPLSSQESRNSEQTVRLVTQSIRNNHNNNNHHHNDDEKMKERVEGLGGGNDEDTKNNKSGDQHKSPSEVKVLPPKDFRGFSFEFPIYNQSATTTPHNDDDERASVSETNKNSSSSSSSRNDANSFPIFSFTNPSINPTSTLSILSSPTIDFPELLNLNFTFNPHPSSSSSSSSSSSILSNTTSEPTTVVDSNNNHNNNNFDFSFINHFKELEDGTSHKNHNNKNSINNLNNNNNNDDGKSNEHNNNYLNNENSFNAPSPSTNLKLQTELFTHEDEEDLSSSVDHNNSQNGNNDRNQNEDLDSGDDSTMSASNKMRGRNPPSIKPSNNMYTPRPGTIPNYPDRPNRLYSAKSRPSNNSNMRHNHNHHQDNDDTDGFTMNKFYGSDKNEVRVPAPSTTSKPDYKFDFSTFTTTNSPSTTSSSSSSSQADNNGASNASHQNDAKSGSLSTSDTTHQFNFNFNSFQPLSPPSSSSSTTTATTTTTTESTKSPALNFNEYQIVTPLSSPSTHNSLNNNNHDHNNKNNFNFDFSQLTTPPPPTGATPAPAYQLTNNPDILTKRTFNFDFDTSASGSSSNFNSNNPFAHLLGGNNGGITGVIGTASSTGAGLGYGGNNNNFNFDASSFNTNYGGGGGHNIPSGTIPIDLASSFIQVGNPPPLRSSGSSSSSNYGQSSNNFDYTGAYSNTNPHLASSSYNFNNNNFGNYGGGSSSSSSGGQQPDYNTITQGIHLLSLLSGNIPQHLLDTQTSASNINNNNHNPYTTNFQQSLSKPQFEIAGLTGYGGSSTAFLNNLQNPSSNNNQYSSSSGGGQSLQQHSENAPPLNLPASINLSPYVPAESRSLFTFGNDLHSSKSIPAATDQQTSFSQIVSKVADFSNIYKKAVGSSTHPPPAAEDSLTSESAVQPSALSPSSKSSTAPILKLEEILKANPAAAEREISKILDMAKAIPTAKLESTDDGGSSPSSSVTNVKGTPSASSSSDLDTAGSEIRQIFSASSNLVNSNVITDKPIINFSKKLLSKSARKSSPGHVSVVDVIEKGLKSGFYT